MSTEYIYDANDDGALNAIALELLDAYLLSADGDDIRERIAGIKVRECSECLEFNLDSNACASHKGECFDCCGCGLLEYKAAK